MSETNAFQITNLSVVYRTEESILPAVRQVTLGIAEAESLGLVGESGSGKTTLALGAIGYLPANGRLIGGRVDLHGTRLLELSRSEMRNVWGARVGLVSQSPQAALNPSLTVGRQLDEMGRRHFDLGRRAARQRTISMLERVDMPDPRSVADRYPHQLSGGMLQRAAIAMTLLTGPELLILDEPTTALDVTTQALVLDLLEELKAEFSTSILYITHNLGVVARICDRVAVMYAGEIIEEAPTAELFARPLHPYTINLLNCVPRFESGPTGQPRHGLLMRTGDRPPGRDGDQAGESTKPRLATIPGSLPKPDHLPSGCVFAPRCPLALDLCRSRRPPLSQVVDRHLTCCWRWEALQAEQGRRAAVSPQEGSTAESRGDLEQKAEQPAGAHFLEGSDITRVFAVPGRKSGTTAVDGVSVWMDRAMTLGLVGESGSGKTTLARVIAGLTRPTRGAVAMDGVVLRPSAAERSRAALKRLQMVFQDPEGSLNPRRTIGQAVLRPLLTLGGLDRTAANYKAYELLSAVRLPASYFHRYPHELSGGEKQRAAIARAFAADPNLVICDEPFSSLDVSVQGSLMNLLVDLQEGRGTSFLFISHDVAAVQHLSHRIAVMYLGALMEQGDAARVLAPPYHPYTEALLSAIPVPDPQVRQARVRLRGMAPQGNEIPSGCRFHPRCPRYLGSICEDLEPPWRHPAVDSGDIVNPDAPDHAIYCHIPLDRLTSLQTATLVETGD